MKKAIFLAAIAALPLAAQGAPRQRIAVLDIRGVQGVSPGTATILTAIVVDDASRAGFDVISQADVSAMIGFEKQKKMLGCSEDSSCLAEIGGALGVDYVLSGQVGQIGSRLHLSFQLLDARKAKVVGRAARFSDRDEDVLASTAQAVVAELLAGRRSEAKPPAQAAAKQTEGTAAPAKADPARKAPPREQPSAKADLSVRPSAAIPPESATPGASRGGWRPSRTAAWITTGAGAALLAGGALFGLKASAARSDLEGAWADPNYAAVYASKTSAVSSARRNANICYVAGVLTAGTGGWMLWRSRTPRLAVVPSGADGTLALAAAGTF